MQVELEHVAPQWGRDGEYSSRCSQVVLVIWLPSEVVTEGKRYFRKKKKSYSYSYLILMCILMRDRVVTAHSTAKWDTGDPGAEEKLAVTCFAQIGVQYWTKKTLQKK